MTSWFVALVFGYSGLIHLQNPYRFYDAILRYDIIFGRFALLMAMSLPIVHVMIAYGLFFRSQCKRPGKCMLTVMGYSRFLAGDSDVEAAIFS